MLVKDARTRTLAVLSQLKFLDFMLVTEKELQESLLHYPVENKTALNTKPYENYCSKKFSSLWETHPPDKEAFVDGLANGRGFQVLLENDRNFHLLHSFPPASTIAENHQKELGELFDDWHAKGRSYYKQMQEEKVAICNMVHEAENFADTVSEEEEYSYITFIEEVPKKLCLIYRKPISSEQKDQEVELLKEECNKELQKTQRNLMSSSCLYIDLVFDLIRIFNREMSLIKQKYLEDVQCIYKEVIEKDEKYILELKQFYLEIFNTGSNYNLEIKNQVGEVVKLDPVFLKLLSKKDFVEMVLKMAFTIHSTLLQERIKKLETSLENYREDTLKFILLGDNVLAKQKKIRNVVLFSNKQKYIMDKLFSNSMEFKNYLGYS